MNRREARETALMLVFESEFQKDLTAEEILACAKEVRDLEVDDYVTRVFEASMGMREEIDRLIETCTNGWKLNRLSKVALAVMRLSVAEMGYLPEEYRVDVPFWVSINEALELVKRYDHDVKPGFVNGILNRAAVELGLKPDDGKGKKAVSEDDMAQDVPQSEA